MVLCCCWWYHREYTEAHVISDITRAFNSQTCQKMTSRVSNRHQEICCWSKETLQSVQTAMRHHGKFLSFLLSILKTSQWSFVLLDNFKHLIKICWQSNVVKFPIILNSETNPAFLLPTHISRSTLQTRGKLLKKHNFRQLTLLWPGRCLDQFHNLACW